MIDLLKLNGDLRAEPHPSIAEIKEFREVIEKEENPAKVLAYIYNVYDPRSAHSTLKLENRKKEVTQQIFEDEDWSPSSRVEDAIEKYKDLNETSAVRLVKSAKKAIRKVEDYFDNTNPSEADNPDRAAKNLLNNVGEIDDAIEGLHDLEERVKKRRDASQEVRGDKKINEFSE